MKRSIRSILFLMSAVLDHIVKYYRKVLNEKTNSHNRATCGLKILQLKPSIRFPSVSTQIWMVFTEGPQKGSFQWYMLWACLGRLVSPRVCSSSRYQFYISRLNSQGFISLGCTCCLFDCGDKIKNHFVQQTKIFPSRCQQVLYCHDFFTKSWKER